MSQIPRQLTRMPPLLSNAAREHKARCKQLPPLKPGEVERLKAEFSANHGVTVCPPRYGAPLFGVRW